MLKKLELFLFPPTCVLTGELTEQLDLQPGLVASWQLTDQEFHANSLTSNAERCLVPFKFAGDLRSLIHQFKYSEQLYLSRLLAEIWLAEMARRQVDLSQVEALVAVPLHPSRLRSRGYNQAYELARILAIKLEIPVVLALDRVRSTDKQVGLKAAQRQQNLRQAFAVSANNLAEFQRIALVDDVITTGATMKFARQALQQACKDLQIEEWAIARTFNI